MANITLPINQYVDGEGPLIGSKLYFYAAGSTVPKKVYNQPNQVSVATQPIIADANGIFPQVFSEGGMYRVQLYDRFDNLLATRDYVDFGNGSDAFPNPENSGYLYYDIDTGTYSWVTIAGDDHKVAVNADDDAPDYLAAKIKDSDTVTWIVEDGKVKASVQGTFDTYRVKVDAADGNPGFLTDKLEDSDTVTWELDGDKLKANVEFKPSALESIPLQNCSTFRDLYVDIEGPHAIGAYFFSKDEITIAKICTVVPNLESLTAGDIQFAIYKPAYIEITGGLVPMVGSAGNVVMDRVATGEINLARQNNIYSVGTLETPVTVKGWFCVVFSNTPSASWPSIYAGVNMAEMMSMAEPEYQVPLQFIRDDIVNGYATIATMWPSTINSLYGINPSIINKNLVPYIRLEMA